MFFVFYTYKQNVINSKKPFDRKKKYIYSGDFVDPGIVNKETTFSQLPFYSPPQLISMFDYSVHPAPIQIAAFIPAAFPPDFYTDSGANDCN